MTPRNGSDLGDMSMLDLFRMEAENQCNQLLEDLLALEQNPTAADLLESLMRASHSIKGAARVVGLHTAVQIAHAMEDVFVAAQDGKITLDQEGIDQMLTGVDLLSSLAQLSDEEIEIFFTDNADKISSLVDAYTTLAKGTDVHRQTSDVLTATIEAAAQTPEITTSKIPVDLSDMSMLDLFRMEAERHSTNLVEDLAALEKDPTSSELLESLMRFSHSMKGAARIVELHAAVKLAHAMEDVFVAAQNKKIIISRADIDILLNGVDLLTTIAKIPGPKLEKWFADHTADIDGLVKSYAELSHRDKTARPAPTAAKPAPAEPEPEQPATALKSTAEKPVQPAPGVKPAEEKKPARRAEDKDGLRAVRVSAQNMDRMMGLAGESLIESRWLPTFNKELLRLKYRQDEMYESINTIRENLQTAEAGELILNLFSDLHDRLERCRNMLIQDMEVLEDHARHATSIAHRLYTEIITSKMRPFSEGIRGFSRMVRDVARELGKEVTFEVIGADTLVDRDILDKIEAPLNHMIRNALDHGIESPPERIAMSKPEKGTIQLIARHSAGMLSIIVRDDGRGINLEKLRQTIVAKKLCTPEITAELSEHELLEFLLLPNFSTKKSVTKVSGRGVGMDVVHSVINEVRGKIRSSTSLNRGSSFELQLPLTLSVLRALLTEISSELYAFPLVSIDHVLQLTPDQILEVEGRQYFTHNEKRIGLVSAQQIFQSGTTSEAAESTICVIVFSDRLNTYGLIVDKFVEVRDLVVQRLDPRLGKVKDINSASILEDGTPVLIIDVEDVLRRRVVIRLLLPVLGRLSFFHLGRCFQGNLLLRFRFISSFQGRRF